MHADRWSRSRPSAAPPGHRPGTTSQRPCPPVASAPGLRWPASGSSIVPSSWISQTTSPGWRQIVSVPADWVCRSVLAATSLTASTRSVGPALGQARRSRPCCPVHQRRGPWPGRCGRCGRRRRPPAGRRRRLAAGSASGAAPLTADGPRPRSAAQAGSSGPVRTAVGAGGGGEGQRCHRSCGSPAPRARTRGCSSAARSGDGPLSASDDTPLAHALRPGPAGFPAPIVTPRATPLVTPTSAAGRGPGQAVKPPPATVQRATPDRPGRDCSRLPRAPPVVSPVNGRRRRAAVDTFIRNCIR